MITDLKLAVCGLVAGPVAALAIGLGVHPRRTK